MVAYLKDNLKKVEEARSEKVWFVPFHETNAQAVDMKDMKDDVAVDDQRAGSAATPMAYPPALRSKMFGRHRRWPGRRTGAGDLNII